MEEITNQVYLNCVRTTVEIVSACTDEQVTSSIVNHVKKMTMDDQRALLSQMMAKEMFNTMCEGKPIKEEG